MTNQWSMKVCIAKQQLPFPPTAPAEKLVRVQTVCLRSYQEIKLTIQTELCPASVVGAKGQKTISKPSSFK